MLPRCLEILRKVVSPQISGYQDTVIKVGPSPGRVHRVALEYSGGHSGPSSVIVKAIDPDWPADPHGADRECRFYATLRPRLDLHYPHIYHVGMDSDTGQRIIVMEDLAPGYWFPPPAHEWTQDEIRRIASAYARLHVQGHACLPSPAERFWMWRPTLYEREWDAEEILGKIQTLVGQEIWPPVKRIERLVAQTLADLQHFGAYPVTLLHNDVYPPNAALPIDPSNPVMILDWEMAGWGLAELDLAFMFMQPFHSTRRIDRGQTLAHYWAQRQALEGKCPPADERQAVQGHAEAVWALSLAATGYRVAADPFPSDSAAAAYWNSMFGVLYEHLIALCERL